MFKKKKERYYINYSYIVNKYTNNVDGFRNIIVSEQFLEDLKIYAGLTPCVKPPACCKNNNIEFTREISFENINDLVNELDFFL